jgi:hypothetical protein
MFYIVQKNVFREENYERLLQTLVKLDLDHEVIDCLPFTTELEFTTERKDVFCFGSVKLANLAVQYNWKPGSFYGNNHDFNVYKHYYKHYLLNYDSVIQEVIDDIEFDTDHKLIRPCKDSKIFNGAVYSEQKWDDVIARIEPKYHYDLIQVANVKKIYKEARVWIVGGKPIISSYYKFHGDQPYEESVEPAGLEFAQNMCDIYQVADAFVMDICLTPDGWKIVEINCINCSGFYKGDLQVLLMAIEDHFN